MLGRHYLPTLHVSASGRHKKEHSEAGFSVCLLLQYLCVFVTVVPITKLFAWGGGGTVEDMYCERLRAEACVDKSAHHALVNAGERDIV
jgi:hypothetical protein